MDDISGVMTVDSAEAFASALLEECERIRRGDQTAAELALHNFATFDDGTKGNLVLVVESA